MVTVDNMRRFWEKRGYWVKDVTLQGEVFYVHTDRPVEMAACWRDQTDSSNRPQAVFVGCGKPKKGRLRRWGSVIRRILPSKTRA